MGLDWFLEDKVVDGRTVTPAETAGRKEVDPQDPQAIAILKKRHADLQDRISDPGPRPVEPPSPGGLAVLAEFFSGAGRQRRRAFASELQRWQDRRAAFDRYNRPFEEVIPFLMRGEATVVVREAAPDRQDALAKYIGTGTCYDFRANELFDDHNDIAVHAARELDLLLGVEIGLDRTPEEMLTLADDFERALDHYLKNASDQDEFSIDIVRAVIPWLRFWGREGHGFVVDY